MEKVLVVLVKKMKNNNELSTLKSKSSLLYFFVRKEAGWLSKIKNDSRFA
jgi:hypothetical protein